MEEIIRIDLPIVKYKLVTEGLLYKVSVTDFAKLLKIIGQQADRTYKAPADYYKEIRELINEAAKTAPGEYKYTKRIYDPDSYTTATVVKVDTHKRFNQLLAKLDAAEKRYG